MKLCINDRAFVECSRRRLPASEGFRAWPFLQSLHLDHNHPRFNSHLCRSTFFLMFFLFLRRLPASEGFRAWPFLQSLHLDHNLLSGSLPASWGGDGSMASLRNLTLTYNMLVGSIPPTWASGTAGKRRFPALQSLILQPGARPSPGSFLLKSRFVSP